MTSRETGSRPTATSLAVAVVASSGIQHLLKSIDLQRELHPDLVVVADSGLDPQLAADLAAWRAESPGTREVIAAPECEWAARNAVLTHLADDARVDDSWWVTFPEAADAWAEDFCRVTLGEAARGRAAVVSGRQYQRAGGATEDTLNVQLDAGFVDGATVVSDLRDSPERFPILLRTALISWRLVREGATRFNRDLDSGFAGLDFMLACLAAADEPSVAACDVAYYFSVRDDAATVGGSFFARPEKFTTVLEHGHLAALTSASVEGRVPEYVQHAVLFDLGWYFRADESLSSQMNAEMHGVEDQFHALVAQILDRIDDAVLEGLSIQRLPIDRFVAWRHGYRGDAWHAEPITLTALDTRQKLVALSYHYTGTLPTEAVMVGGQEQEPLYAKSRDLIYAGRTLGHERILWLPSDQRVEVRLDGVAVPLARMRQPRAHTRWSPEELRETLGSGDAGAPIASTLGEVLRRAIGPAKVRSWIIRAIAKSAPVKRRLGGSWVLMDRVDAAHDNAEHLFKHLRAEHPQRRVWFAIDGSSADYKRLKSEGADNLLRYGSLKWMLVCLNATHVLSSQAGPYVDNPKALRAVRRPRWRFVFLQHGVVHTGLHRWLNRRQFDLFLTSTTDEYAAIVGHHSPYRFTPHEVALTGMPRFDRLRRLAEAAPAGRAIVVAPSWRESLFTSKADGKGLREATEDFATTEYAQQWRSFLSSSELKRVASESGVRIDFMPHPNIRPFLEQFDLPEYVNVLSYATHDIQRVLVDAAVLVTDYSSVAFDAAYIDRPTVYFQFDRADVFRGAHTIRQGYFSYDDDGFGPVVKTASQAVGAVDEFASNAFAVPTEYAERMERAFPLKDQGNCARVVEAVGSLERRPQRPTSEIPLAPRPRPTPVD